MTIVNYDWDEIEDNIAEEYDDTGATVAEYTTEPGLYGNVLSQRRDAQVSYYHYDGQGSTLALTNPSGDVTDTYAYSAFGGVTTCTGRAINPFQYIGKKGYYRDFETGTYEVRRREFDIRQTRWLSADPANTRTLYIYVSNCPLRLIDASGLEDIQFGDDDPIADLPVTVMNCTRAQEKALRYALHIILDTIKDKGNSCFKGGANIFKQDQICREQLAECITKTSQSITFKCLIGSHSDCRGKTAFSRGDCPISKDKALEDACRPKCHFVGGYDIGGHIVPFPIWSDPTCNVCPEYLLEGSELVVCFGSAGGLPDIGTNLPAWMSVWANVRKLMELLVHELAHQCIGGHTIKRDTGMATCGRPDALVVGQDFRVNCIYNPAPMPPPPKPGEYP